MDYQGRLNILIYTQQSYIPRLKAIRHKTLIQIKGNVNDRAVYFIVPAFAKVGQDTEDIQENTQSSLVLHPRMVHHNLQSLQCKGIERVFV